MEEINTTSSQFPDITDQADNSSKKDFSRVGLKSISGIESELNSLYTGVGMRDISYSCVIELRGNDVLDFLHRISTNSVKNLAKEEVAKTIFTTEKGRIIDIAAIINLDEHQLLVSSQEHQEKMMMWLNKYVISDDVKINNINGKYTLLEMLGPQADSFMTLISGNIVNNINPNTIKIINTEGIIFFLMKHHDHNGQLIYWILADPIYAQKLIRYIVENRGPFDFNLIGEEVIARLDTYDKVQKSLCGFTFSEKIDDYEKFALFDESNIEAGNITSTIYSYKFKKSLGLGFVKRKYCEEGTVLTAKNSNRNPI